MLKLMIAIPSGTQEAQIYDAERRTYLNFPGISKIVRLRRRRLPNGRNSTEMAKTTVTKQALTYLLGVCVPSAKQNAAKIRIRRSELDRHLLMYFNSYEFIYATDPEKLCKTGDTVLIQSLPEKLTRVITHKVVEVIYPLGDMTDPITGKKIVAGRYRDEIQKDAELFGTLESTFKHEKMPPRGTMEDKRDFSRRETYVKHHDNPKDEDPYALNPY